MEAASLEVSIAPFQAAFPEVVQLAVVLALSSLLVASVPPSPQSSSLLLLCEGLPLL